VGKIRITPLALLLILVCTGTWLSGCASPAETKAMVPSHIDTLRQHPYTVSIRTQGGSETGSIDTPNVSDDDFAAALEEAIIKSSLFARVVHAGSADYALNVNVVYASKPIFGKSLTVKMEAGWSLIDTATQAVVMREPIKSSYKTTPEDALGATTRLRLAVEGAARENIRLGLSAISRLQLNK